MRCLCLTRYACQCSSWHSMECTSRVVLRKGSAEGQRAFLTIEVSVAVAAAAEQRRVVDEGVAAVKGFVGHVVLPVLPVMGNQRIGLAAHDLVDGQARLEGCAPVPHEVEAARKPRGGRASSRASFGPVA